MLRSETPVSSIVLMKCSLALSALILQPPDWAQLWPTVLKIGLEF